MTRFLRRAAAFAVAVSLGLTGLAECAGWAATAEARMSCCSDGGSCPMHGGSEENSITGLVITQAQADSCCAASDGTESATSAAAFAVSLSTVLVVSTLHSTPVTVASVALGPSGEYISPPGGHVSRHLLLSVFLL